MAIVLKLPFCPFKRLPQLLRFRGSLDRRATEWSAYRRWVGKMSTPCASLLRHNLGSLASVV